MNHLVANSTAARNGNSRHVASPTLPRMTAPVWCSKSRPSSAKSVASSSIPWYVTQIRPAGDATAHEFVRSGGAGTRYSPRWKAVHRSKSTPSSSTEALSSSSRASGDSSPSCDSSSWPSTMYAACRPTAANDVCGCPLRKVPGQVRTRSATTPTAWLGVSAGSKPGRCSRIVEHQPAGAPGDLHLDGSRLNAVWAGATSVPVGPSTSRSACTTAVAPPQTHPRERNEECTRMMSPGCIPSSARSSPSEALVCKLYSSVWAAITV